MKRLSGLLVIVLPLVLAVTGFVTVGARTTSSEDFNAATTYKTKCQMCHGPKSEKKFDKTKSDDEHIQIILKGKKAEKPPNMPAYAEKGMTPEEAKAMLDYMKSLQQ